MFFEPKRDKNKVSAVACSFCSAFILFPGSGIPLGQRQILLCISEHFLISNVCAGHIAFGSELCGRCRKVLLHIKNDPRGCHDQAGCKSDADQLFHFQPDSVCHWRRSSADLFFESKRDSSGSRYGRNYHQDGAPSAVFYDSSAGDFDFDRNLDRIFPNQGTFLYVSILVALTILVCILLFYLQKSPDALSQMVDKVVKRFGKTEASASRLKKISGEVEAFLSHLSLFFSGSKKNIFFSILTTLLSLTMPAAVREAFCRMPLPATATII